MTRTQALMGLLEDLRQADIDSFMDIYYLVCGELGMDFDDASCMFDFVDLDRLKVRIQDLTDQGLYEAYVVDGILARLAYYVASADARAFRAVALNQEDLTTNPFGKPQVLLDMAQKTNDRLLSSYAGNQRQDFADHFDRLRAQYFTRANLAQWEVDAP